MIDKEKKTLNRFASRTKIYLIVIAVLLILLCIKNSSCIIPSIFFYIVLLGYAYFTNNKGKNEINEHIQDITLNTDRAAKKTIIDSPFALIIASTNGEIIWKNNKFSKEFANLSVNEQIKILMQEIKNDIVTKKIQNTDLFEKTITIENKTYKIYANMVKKKTIKDRNYERKNDNEYVFLLYFIDQTESNQILNQYINSKACIGIIMIDNYEEIIQRAGTEEKTIMFAEIERKIYDWAKMTNGIIIKNDRDKYIFVFEQGYLDDIIENKFSILDKVKEIQVEDKIQLTLSIAMSTEGNTYYEKYKSANTALDIILGRGGDQVIVRHNNKYTFFGGNTQELEKRTKVKARTIAKSLETLIKDADNVLIMGHRNTDIDSIGSALGIYRIAKSLDRQAYIVNEEYGASLQNFMPELLNESEYEKIIIGKNEALDKINEKTLLVVVDTHKISYVEAPELLSKTNNIFIVDHHRRSTDYIENTVLAFHEVYASSASELVTELIQYISEDIELSTLEVEGLYAGLMIDTKDFTFKTGVRTFEAAAYLRKCGVDIIRVKKLFQNDLESYNKISDIVRNVEIVNNNIGISIYNENDENVNLICSIAADELLKISDIEASFVIGKNDEKVFISGRSLGDINVQIILEKLGGGGHSTLAGAQIQDATIEQVKQMLVEKINEYFEEISN